MTTFLKSKIELRDGRILDYTPTADEMLLAYTKAMLKMKDAKKLRMDQVIEITEDAAITVKTMLLERLGIAESDVVQQHEVN
jgi:hypothetical protein